MYSFKNWYVKAKTMECYNLQKEEFFNVLSPYMDKINSVLDVGCGDGRLLNEFKVENKKGIDIQTTGDDITESKTWENLGKFDLVFSSLTMMHIEEEKLPFVFSKMCEASNKYIFLYEEEPLQAKGKYSEIPAKYCHDYFKLGFSRLAFFGRSKFNKSWGYYFFSMAL